ncbi:MAG: hypothetical protein ABJQ71_15985 [Roseibium sp.]
MVRIINTQCHRYASLFLFVLFFWNVFLSSESLAQSAVDDSEKLVTQDSLLARQSSLLAVILQSPDNLDVAFEYASVSAMLGDYEAAISTFERMLVFAPSLPRVQLELGVMYYRLGSLETARYYFQASLEAPNVPPEVKQKVQTYLAAVNAKERPSVFQGNLIIGARYQSNANAAPGGRNVTLNGRGFLLDETATGQADYNLFAAGRAYGSYDLGMQGDLLEADLVFYTARYADIVRLDTGLAELTVGPSFNMARFNIDNVQMGVYAIGSGVRLDHQNYNGALGLGTRLVAQPDIQTEITAKFEWRNRWYNDTTTYPTVSDRNGNYVLFASKISRQLNKALRARVLALADFEEAEVKSLQSWEAGAGIGATYRFQSPIKQLPTLWAFDLEAGYIHRQYSDPDALIDRDNSQFNHEGWVRGALSIPIKYDFSLGFTGEFRRQYSNYDLSSYSNASAMVAVMKAF